jgi:hypothetical protein
MRFLTVASMAVAFIASVSAKISFGPCNTETIRFTHDDYFAVTEAKSHYLLAIDRQFNDLIEAL